MKLKKFKLTEDDQVFIFDEDLNVFVSEDREFVLEFDEVDELIENDGITFEYEDVIVEAKEDDEDESDEDESEDDEEDDEDMDEALELQTSIAELLDFKVELSEEDKAAMFGDDETITENVQNKLHTLFEATVRVKALEIIEQISDKYETYAEAKFAANEKKVHEEVNEYLDYVISEWVAENEIAIESSLKLEMNDKFIESLGELYKEHYIEVPEGRYDILEGLADKVEELEEKLEVEVVNNAKLLAENKTAMKDDVIKSLGEKLTESQKEKFASLVENFKDNDVESFETKATEIFESIFKETDTGSMLTEDLPKDESTIESDDDEIDNSLIGRASRL